MLEVPFHLASQRQATGLIPPGSTTLHLLLAVHIAAALTCVATGAVAALSPKRPGRHPRLGTLYYRSLSVVVASAAWLAALRWPQDASLLVLGTLAFAAATLGRTARRRRWHWHRWRWVGLHLVGMSASYILLLTAFYVDNGKHYPSGSACRTLPTGCCPARSDSPSSLAGWPATTAWHRIDPPTPRPLTDVAPQPRPQPRARTPASISQDPGATMAAARYARPPPPTRGRRRGSGVVRRGA